MGSVVVGKRSRPFIAIRIGLLLILLGSAHQTLGAVNVSELSLDVTALRTMYDFELSPEQLAALRLMIHKPASTAVKGPDKPQRKLHEALVALRKELITAEDPDAIGDLQAKVDEARDAASAEVHDEIIITDAAKKLVPDFMRLLSPVQIARYLEANKDEISQPIERVTEILNACHKTDELNWNKLRERIPSEVSILVAGLDKARGTALKSDLTSLFDRVRLMSDSDYLAKRRELLDDISRKLGTVDSFDVLRHCVEHDVAEFFSNPRLIVALDAKQKH